ncbi:MAG TPA: ABC transporter ATP-binding protein, partial [Actinomycetota bacterium]|nr:ABC transporter ATP-binding protein [Actinomycetota bacterium]
FEVGVEGDPAAVEAALRSVPGLRSLERGPEGLWTLRAETDPRPAVVSALIGRGLVPHHLQRREEDLDELYRRYFHRALRAEGAR